MKIKVCYSIDTTIDIPDKLDFIFTKDKDEWTEREKILYGIFWWDALEEMLGVTDMEYSYFNIDSITPC